MKPLSPRLLLGLLLCATPAFCARAGEEGFTVILDKTHTQGWKYLGDGEMTLKDGVATTPSRQGARFGLYWYGTRRWTDFVLKLEFSVDSPGANSGIFLRFPDPRGDYDTAAAQGYEVDIFGDKTGTILAPPDRVRPTHPVTLQPGDWNECEITVIGQKYAVTLNGRVINEYTGKRALSGYVGLSNWKGSGEVHFRNVRIKDLASEAGGAVSSKAPAPSGSQSVLEMVSEHAPDALEWALAPLDRTTPPDLRQNLTVLREDLLDEGAKNPMASGEAYRLGQLLCNELIGVFNERDGALVRAGYTVAQANANMAISGQPPEPRRSPQMRWPQYFSDKERKKEITQQKEDAAALAKQRPSREWAERGALLRRNIDRLYAQFREASRRSPGVK